MGEWVVGCAIAYRSPWGCGRPTEENWARSQPCGREERNSINVPFIITQRLVDSGFQPLMLDWGLFQVVTDMEGECCGLYFCKKEERWAAFTGSTVY